MPTEKYNSADTRSGLSQAMQLFGAAGENAGADFLAMTEAVGRLNGFQADLYKRNNKGVLAEYTKEKHTQMLALYEEAIRKNTEYLSHCSEEDKKQEVFRTADFVQKLLLRDRNHLIKYDPAAKENFPSILNRARSVTVNTSGVQLEKWGAAQSQRIPMTVTGRDGKQVSGVFTPERRSGIEKPFKEMTDEICAKCPTAAPFFSKLLDKFRQTAQAGAHFTVYGTKTVTLHPHNDRQDYFLLLACCESDRKITPLATAKTFSRISGIPLRQLVARNDFKDAIDIFVEKANQFHIGESINAYDLELKEGERVDNRNSAMSTVASLLGRQELVCSACDMTVINDGKEVSGTFMELAKGVDPSHPTEEAKSYDPDKDKSPEALRAVADLQVIDYICGNVDRHAFNYFYQFEKNGNKLHLTGIVGIDNDSSFGAGDNLHQANFNRLTGTDNMLVVTQSMADRVNGLTAEALSFSLRSHGLGEKSVTAACKRLEHLQECLRVGAAEFQKDENRQRIASDPAFTKRKFIRTVPDNEFVNFSFKKLRGGLNFPGMERKDNLFNTVREYPIDYTKTERKTGAPAYVQSNSRLSADAMKQRFDKTLVLLQQLKDATNYRGTSDAFEKMRGSLNDLSRFYSASTKQLPDFDSLLAMNKALMRLKTDAKDYLIHKAQEKKKPSDYALRRKALAEEIFALASTDPIDPATLSEEDKADLRHNAEQNTQNICLQALTELKELRMKKEGLIKDAPENAAEAENAPVLGGNP